MEARMQAVYDRLRSQTGILESFNDEELLEIITKAHGVCYLCGNPIHLESDTIDGDHIDPDGGDRPENICLTHKKCNQKKRDLPLGLAKKWFELERFSKSYSDLPSFDDALDHFVEDNRQIIAYEYIEEEGQDYLSLNFGDYQKIKTPCYEDPATESKFCFCNVPIKNIFNDTDAQPRRITWRHVWRLLLDFTVHPIHEPSSLRLNTIPETQNARLLLCDGQHKALAQIILDREIVPAKIYVDPDIQKIRTLIDTIQNRIKKMPLYPSIVMEKLSVIHGDRWQRFINESSPPHTERRFIRTFRSDEQKLIKNELREAIYNSILYGATAESEHGILEYIEAEKRRAGPDKVMSMFLFKTTILKNFVYQDPCSFQVGSEDDLRLKEVQNMRRFLDQVVSVFFKDPLGILKVKDNKMIRIFKSGSMRVWVKTLRSAINNRLSIIEHKEMDKTFLREISEPQWNGIKAILERLEQHSIWSDDSPDVESKLNENKIETTERLFDEYTIKLNARYLLAVR